MMYLRNLRFNYNGGEPMLQCSSCLKWSHIACYSLSSTVAKSIRFSQSCVPTNAADYRTTTLESFNDILVIQKQLAEHVCACNVQLFLLIHDEIAKLKQNMDHIIYTKLSLVEDTIK